MTTCENEFNSYTQGVARLWDTEDKYIKYCVAMVHFASKRFYFTFKSYGAFTLAR